MIAVCDMGPLHYLILIECDHILPQLFSRVLTARVVVEKEMLDSRTPEPVRRWAQNPPAWLEVIEPLAIQNIPTLGRAGERGDGDRAVISLALEQEAEVVVMDDIKARKEAQTRGLQPIWMLELLDEAAERGLITDLTERLECLEQKTPFYVGPRCQVVIDGMKERDLQRKQTKSTRNDIGERRS